MLSEKKGEKMSESEQGIIDAVDALFGGSVDLSQYDYQQQCYLSSNGTDPYQEQKEPGPGRASGPRQSTGPSQRSVVVCSS